jgi:hypothetical protein
MSDEPVKTCDLVIRGITEAQAKAAVKLLFGNRKEGDYEKRSNDVDQ